LNDQLNSNKHNWQLKFIVSQKVTRVTSHHLYYSVCSKCPPPARAQARDAAPLACSTFNNRVTRSGPLAVDALFQFVDVRDLDTIDSPDYCLISNRFSMIFMVPQCFSEMVCWTQYEFIVVKGQTTTSAFHKVVQQQY